MNKKENKGFTLAELLVVVAIIAVLVAIAIPVFTNQLEKARQATDLANIRAAYAEIMMAVNEDDKDVDTSKSPYTNDSLGITVYPLKSSSNVYYFTPHDEYVPNWLAAVEFTHKEEWSEESRNSLNELFFTEDSEYTAMDYYDLFVNEYGYDPDNACGLLLYTIDYRYENGKYKNVISFLLYPTKKQ